MIAEVHALPVRVERALYNIGDVGFSGVSRLWNQLAIWHRSMGSVYQHGWINIVWYWVQGRDLVMFITLRRTTHTSRVQLLCGWKLTFAVLRNGLLNTISQPSGKNIGIIQVDCGFDEKYDCRMSRAFGSKQYALGGNIYRTDCTRHVWAFWCYGKIVCWCWFPSATAHWHGTWSTWHRRRALDSFVARWL